jgi:hypothetical protein
MDDFFDLVVFDNKGVLVWWVGLLVGGKFKWNEENYCG